MGIVTQGESKGIAAPPLLTLAGITKRFPGCLANDSVDLAVLPGEIHALLGENGAGKSTLVKVIYGVLQPDAGEIRWQGKPIRIPSPNAARRLGIGMVFQHFSLFEALTVAENIALAIDDPAQRRGIAIQPFQLQRDAPAAALPETGSERQADLVRRRRVRHGEHGAGPLDGFQLEMPAADAAGDALDMDEHSATGLPRGRTGGCGDGDENRGLVAPRQLQCLVEPIGCRVHDHSPARARWAGSAARCRSSSIASNTRSGVAGASKSGKRR